MLILVSSAPFENEIRARKEEHHWGLPPVLPPKREEIHSLADDNDEREVEARESAENELPVKMARAFNEESAEEFFNGLERELAIQTDKRDSRHKVRNRNTEEERNDEELQDRELPEGREEMPEEDEEEARELAQEKELEMFNRELEHEFEEKLAREMAEEENKRELGENEEDMELFRRRGGSYVRELPEESEEIYNREIVPEVAEEEYNNEREFSVEENEKDEEDEGEHLEKLNERSVMDERALNHKREEEEEIATPREMDFRSMLEDSVEEFPEWNDEIEDTRSRRLEELNKRAEEFQKRMLERQSERERQRFDYHDNEEREKEELRERQRQRTLVTGRKIHEREMEGRKQREEIGSHGMRREERERFRFRARSE